jgi:dTDP-4-amino-4,6-dideoxygalactose transaminase
VGGRAVERFEAEFARWCEADDAVGVSSGTEALVLVLRALRVDPDTQLVTPETLRAPSPA